MSVASRRLLVLLAVSFSVVVVATAPESSAGRRQDSPTTTAVREGGGADPGVSTTVDPAGTTSSTTSPSTPSTPTTSIVAPGSSSTSSSVPGSTSTAPTTTVAGTSTSTTPTSPPTSHGESGTDRPGVPAGEGPEPPIQQSDPPGADLSPGTTVRAPGRPANVRSSNIPLGSIALAVLAFLAIGAGAYFYLRRERLSGPPLVRPPWRRIWPAVRQKPEIPEFATDHRTALDLLLELGKALIDSGIAVPQVETTLDRVAKTFGIAGMGALVLPNSLVISIPDDDGVRTEVGRAGSSPLRLDQIDEVTRLVQKVVHGEMDATATLAALRTLRVSDPPYSPALMVVGHVISTVGLIMLLGGTWREVVLGAIVGGAIGWVIVFTRGVESIAYLPFRPLIAAAVCSIVVFGATRVIGGLIVFPLLLAPLVTELPGSKLTMGVLELVTGHIVSGASRVASGGMQLVLLALGLAAGVQLIGAGDGVRTSTASGFVAVIAPWLGVALFGIGIVWLNGAASSARWWIMGVIYVAYAGQVIGALFFGPALSAFFGALAMTPIAVLASRQPRGPSTLVTFLPGFWILVPGALGLRGVSLLLGEGDPTSGNTLLVVLTSMVGISLGVLVGLTLVAGNRSNWWIGDLDARDETGSDSTRRWHFRQVK
ncbi:MAG: threonine/serine exporter family protein [Microthrixaceae bacterium]